MITNKKFSRILFIFIVLYFISDFFFTDAILYLVGGLFGVLSKAVGLKSFYLVWTVTLVGFIVLSFKLKNRFAWFTTLVIIGVLLYLIDAFLYELLPDVTSKTFRYLHMSLSIFLKSIALALIMARSYKAG